MRDLNCGRWKENYCATCKRYDFHWGGCADQNALLDYEYGKHPIPYTREAPMPDPEPKESTKDYSKGYSAGRRYVDSEVLDLRREVRDLQRTAVEKREERIYFKALELVLAHCHGWQMDKKPIDNAQRYSKLAKIFADHAIEHMED